MSDRICASVAIVSLLGAGCGGGGGSATTPMPSTAPTTLPRTTQCSGAVTTTSPSGMTPSTPLGLTVPAGIRIETIATVPGARELAALPNGDLLVGSGSNRIYLVPTAEGNGAAGAPIAFATIPDANAAGVTFDQSSCTIFVGATGGVYAIPYGDADTSARSVNKIASVRAQNAGGHSTTSVAVSGSTLYASVGSSCNACTETDPTRATIQQMRLDGSSMTVRALHIRNAIALSVNPQSGHLWAGDAGQDGLPTGHPYEFFDDVSAHVGVADYGWPLCEENAQTYGSGASCGGTVTPLVELPAYSTIVGAVFYPLLETGAEALPQVYRGGAFLAAHGSWHQAGGRFYSAPQVVFVPMHGDAPQTSVDWSDPTRQWVPFVSGFQQRDGVTRIGRPTGLAVGPQGSLFVADDASGRIYRVHP